MIGLGTVTQISDSEPMTFSTSTIQVPVAAIRAGDNDRTEFVDAELRALAASIEAQGLMSEPTVRVHPEGGYELIAGERRIRAIRLLGWDTVTVKLSDADDALAAEMMLVENEVRSDLNPVDQARAYAKRIECGATAAEVATMLGKTERFVTYRVMLLDLCDRVLDLIRTGTLRPEVAISMVGLDPDRQMLAIAGLNEGLTQAQFGALVERLHGEQAAQPMFDADSFFQVEEYVTAAKATAKLGAVGQLRVTMQKMIVAMEQAGIAPELVEEARAALQAETTRKAEKALERYNRKHGR
jgi:ParB family transcriptional regulator, chromosome partitioning protein